MIYDFKLALAALLQEIVPNCDVYTYESKQFTEFPAFFITRVDNTRTGGKMKCIKNVGFDVTYIQEAFDEEDMDSVEHALLEIEEVGSYKLTAKKTYQVDDTLHFQFEVKYFEEVESTDSKMNELENTEEIKDE